MLQSITARQLRDWELFFGLEPRGDRRSDYRTAQILQVLIELKRDSKKNPEATKLEDLLLKFEEKKKLTWQDHKAHMLQMAAASNSAELKKRDRIAKKARRS